MTEKQFWNKLEECAAHGGKSMLEAAQLLQQAYDENLMLYCGCHHTRPDMLNQLYVNLDEANPTREGNRYMLCYTSRKMLVEDPMITEAPEKLPVRFVIDNMRSKPVIGGLLFNRHREDLSLVVPKQFLSGPGAAFNTLAEVIAGKNPFNLPIQEK